MMQFNLDTCVGYHDKVLLALMVAADKNQFILGENVRAFEKEWAEFNNAAFCVGVGNGTDALRIAMLALGVKPGDEVISPAHNVSYTALAVTSIGAKNVYVDVDPKTMLMDLNQIEALITPKTRAIIPVHLYGQMVNMAELHAIARQYSLLLIEDAAQAHGARHETQPPGTFSDAAAFSFYPTKNLGAWGEAGGIITNTPAVAERARMLRDGGRIDRYIHFLPGINSGLDELQAAVLRAKLPYLKQSNEARRDLALRYTEELAGVGDLQFQHEQIDTENVWHLFVIRTASRDKLMAYLKTQDIPSLIHYPVIIPDQPFAIADAQGQGPFPVSRECASEVLSLPMFPAMTEVEQAKVIDAVKRFYSNVF